jgi:hypothetical protein
MVLKCVMPQTSATFLHKVKGKNPLKNNQQNAGHNKIDL